jgi:hypothetical protein
MEREGGRRRREGERRDTLVRESEKERERERTRKIER